MMFSWKFTFNSYIENGNKHSGFAESKQKYEKMSLNPSIIHSNDKTD